MVNAFTMCSVWVVGMVMVFAHHVVWGCQNSGCLGLSEQWLSAHHVVWGCQNSDCLCTGMLSVVVRTVSALVMLSHSVSEGDELLV